jgi:mannosyltransferase
MSIYYALPRLSAKLFGTSEIAYRLPSLLAMAIALWLIARIAAKLIHPDAAWFTVFACLALRGFNYQAADARPYALGTCVLCLSAWLLMRWLDSSKWLDALLFVLSASLLWRVHLVFWPFYAMFAIYAIVRLARRDTPVDWLRAAAVFGLLGALLVPVALSAAGVLRTADAHVVSAMPAASDLAAALKLGLLATGAIAAAILGRWYKLPAGKFPQWSQLALIAAWWLCAPLGLFAFSWVTGNVTFVPRYLFLSLPGAALAATAAAALSIPPRHWRTLSLAMGVGVLLLLGQWTELAPLHHGSDWRRAARALNARQTAAPMPVICPSPFIEARPPVWRADYPLDSFLYSHLLYYKVVGKEYPFPYESSPEAEREARELTQGALITAGRFALYGPARSVLHWRDWFSAQPELAAWRSHSLGAFGDVEALVFENTRLAAPR